MRETLELEIEFAMVDGPTAFNSDINQRPGLNGLAQLTGKI